MSPEAEQEQDQRPEPSVLRSLRGLPGVPMNTQNGRRYFISNPADEQTSCGMKFMLDVGWHKVNHKRDPERLRGGATNPNGDVTWKGQVLLWISDADHKKVYGEIEEATAELNRRARGPGGISKVEDVAGQLASDI